MKKLNVKKCPTGHIAYPTQEAVQRACDVHVQDAKQHGAEGKSWKRLNVFLCRACTQWHVGHAKQSWPEKQSAAPAAQPLTAGQLRRKEEHERKEAARHQQRAQAFADYRENMDYARYLLNRELAATAKAGKP